MPIYDYHCANCGKTFSLNQSMSEHVSRKVNCPKCKSQKVERMIAPFFAKTAKKS